MQQYIGKEFMICIKLHSHKPNKNMWVEHQMKHTINIYIYMCVMEMFRMVYDYILCIGPANETQHYNGMSPFIGRPIHSMILANT